MVEMLIASISRLLHLAELLKEADHFVAVPGDWYIVLTDIKNSTQGVTSFQNPYK